MFSSWEPVAFYDWQEPTAPDANPRARSLLVEGDGAPLPAYKGQL